MEELLTDVLLCKKKKKVKLFIFENFIVNLFYNVIWQLMILSNACIFFTKWNCIGGKDLA